MGLPASESKVLEKIENALRGSDPHLVSLFVIFTRLNCGEEMPTVEQLRARISLILLRGRRRLSALGRWFGAAPRARLRAAIFFPLALAVVAASVVIGSRFSAPQRCPAGAAATRTARPSSRAGLCPPLISNADIIAR
jgi:Protein of unknown function (DUF3040)